MSERLLTAEDVAEWGKYIRPIEYEYWKKWGCRMSDEEMLEVIREYIRKRQEA